jgi:hypothetical protein
MTTESKPSPGNSLFVILFKSDNDLHGLYKSEINSIFLPYKGETGLSHTSRAQKYFFLNWGLQRLRNKNIWALGYEEA